MTQEKRVVLEKSISPVGVLALAIGSIIGWGSFILPGTMMEQSGPVGAAIGITLGGLAMLVIAKSYGYMVQKVPVSGGEFAYAYNGFGRYHAYICGWFLTLGYLSIVPLNATALSLLAKFVAPDVFARGYLYTIAGSEIYAGEVGLASAAIMIFGYLNYRGSKAVTNVQVYMVGLLVAAVFLIAGGAGFTDISSFTHLTPGFNPEVPAIAGVVGILAIAPFLFVGFDTIPQAAEEYDFPPARANLLIMVSIIVGGLMYILVLLATGVVFPWQELIEAKHVWPTGYAMQAAIGKVGIWFLVIAISMGICTGINGFYMATSRLLFSMGRAKVLPAWFIGVDEKSGVPKNAVLFTAALALMAPWFGRNVIIWVVDMAALGTAFGYMYTCFGAYRETKKADGAEVEIPIKSTTALMGALVSFGVLLLLCVPGSPGFMAEESWYACGIWVMMGGLFYLSQAKKYSSLTDGELDYLILDKSRDVSGDDLVSYRELRN
ncbi:APC family permease [Desulforhopalus singaporensis]|uniref:Amino acid/polyamine/organocation transporter, APC superfamily n=1 Tax=Desulforhopalus singaporensis TaxID=91360 RepID=A0A1H0T051_9BACT|nr:APC family permease [Desulforhopalus singaporensis]SDP47487.1 amino acid/polyamine/organocation transporter, APC superfamily [Desulforhopalus singaporensis]